MNEKRIKSLVEILKTTIRELEDEMQSDVSPYLSMDYTDEGVTERSSFNVDYSDVLTYYSNDYGGEYDGIG